MTKRHRRHSTAKKREVVEAYLNGEALQALSRRHDMGWEAVEIGSRPPPPSERLWLYGAPGCA